jgi:hypothetical protein
MDVHREPRSFEPSPHEGHEQRLAAALRELIAQADIGEYRDAEGHLLTHNTAFLKAQAVVEEFGLTHEQLCESLDDCDPTGDLTDAARRLFQRRLAAEQGRVPR